MKLVKTLIKFLNHHTDITEITTEAANVGIL